MEEYNGNIVKKTNYRELQALAKRLNLPGNLKHHLLFEVIKARECGDENVVQKILAEQRLERARRKSEKQEGKDAGYKHLNIFQEKKKAPRPKVIKEPEKPKHFHNYEPPKAPRKPLSGPDSYLRSLLALPHQSLRELMFKNHQESLLRAKKMREAALGIGGYQVDNTGAHCSTQTQVITEYQHPYDTDNNIKFSTNFSDDGNPRNIEIQNLQSTECNGLQTRTEIHDPFMQYYPSYMTTTTTKNENIISNFIPEIQSQPEYAYYPSNQIENMPYQENSYSHDYLKFDNNNIQYIQNNPVFRPNISPINSETMSASEPEFDEIYSNEMRYYQNQNQVENMRNNEMQVCYPSYNYRDELINQPPQRQMVYESGVQDYALEQFTPISPDPLSVPNNNLSNNNDVDYEEISSDENYLDLAQEIEITTCPDKEEEASTDVTLMNMIDREEYQEWSYEYTAPDNTLNYVHGITHASYFQLA